MENKLKSSYVIVVLMVTIALDIMGLGLILPIIPGMVLDSSNHLFLSSYVPDNVRYFWYAIVMGVWPFGMFMGSSILGVLSDVYGRKKVLLIALLGVALSYFISVIAVYLGSLNLFILSRLTIGIFGASFGLAQASIIDVSEKDMITRNLSFVTLAASIGFIFGPALSTVIGYLFHGVYQSVLPCLIGGSLTLINFVSVWLFLAETYTKEDTNISSKINIIDIIFSFRIMFFDKRVRILALSFLLMQVGWGFYIQDYPLVLSSIFNLEQSQIGLSFVYAAFGYFIAIIFILPKLEKYFSLKSIVIVNGVLLGIVLFLSATANYAVLEYIYFILASIFQLLFYSSLLAWFSYKVNANEQGKIIGGTVSVFGLAWAFNALLIGSIAGINIMLPFYIAAFLFVVSAFVIIYVKATSDVKC